MDSDCSLKLKDSCSLKAKTMTNIDCIKKQKDHFPDKCPSSQNYVFSSSYVYMDVRFGHKEG